MLKKLGEFPEAVGEAALKRMPHRITNYIYELASTFHSFYNAEKVLDLEQVEKTTARLSLIKVCANYAQKCLRFNWGISSRKNVSEMDEAAFLWFYGKAAFLMGQFLNLKRGARSLKLKLESQK